MKGRCWPPPPPTERSEPIAWFTLVLERPTSRARAWLEIDQLSVDQHHRRRGVGRALVARVVEEAEAARLHRIEVSSWAFDEATQRLFRSLGFVPKVVRFKLGGSSANAR